MKTNTDGRRQSIQETTLSTDLITEYLNDIRVRGLADTTVSAYRSHLTRLYERLPADKHISREILKCWQDDLRKEGYEPHTINVYTSAVNGLLNYLDRRDLQIKQIDPPAIYTPTMITREEYLRLLSAARVLSWERTYLLVKVFAGLGLTVKDLRSLTVESVRAGRITALSESCRKTVNIPPCLGKELQTYIRRIGLRSGPIFVTRNGKTMDRSNITFNIQRLSHTAKVPPDKCNPRCLRKLYLSTLQEITENTSTLIAQAYYQLLDKEQQVYGWDS